jgi:hypothetical protein
LSNLEQNMRDKLAEFSREFGLIVMGYAGNDKSVMDALATLARSSGSFRHGVYWCVRRGSSPGPRLRQFLRNERVYWVEIDGFDQVMADLVDRMSLPLPAGVASPHRVVVERTQHLFAKEEPDAHPYIRYASGICGERYRVACDLLRAHGLQSTSLKEDDGKMLFDDMADFTVPFMQARYAANDGEYTRAESILRQLLSTVPSERVWSVYIKLLDCLLDQGTRKDNLLEMLKVNVPPHGTSYDLARCSYYALFLNEAELAQQFTERALRQNAGCSLALVNKGLALLQVGNAGEVSAISNLLVADGMDERFRAAGYAMVGNLGSLVVPLQRAIALDDYSPKDALRDVAFRPYWTNAAFLDALRPFTKAPSSLHPAMLEHYPMSASEQEIALASEAGEGPSNSGLQQTRRSLALAPRS